MRAVFSSGLFALLSAVPLAAQSFNLRDLLTDFLREGITLADPPAGSPFPSHAHHFIGDDSPSSWRSSSSTTSSPTSSRPSRSPPRRRLQPTSYDPELGVFTRASDSFGPIYAERADTIGKGKFNFGINYSHFTFDDIDNLSLRDGDLRLVFTHQDINHDGTTSSRSSRAT